MTNKSFFPNCYFYEKEDGVFYFGGIIASLRVLGFGKNKTIVTSIGVGPSKYIEVITKGKYFNHKHYGLKGRAMLMDKKQKTYNAFIAKYY